MSAPMPDGNGAILLDGARYESATAWLYQCFPSSLSDLSPADR
jgi:hypothetical protein